MDKYTETDDLADGKIEIWPLENCRFAYTINSAQPVRCTWISDQPLFYADCDEALEDELFDDPILEALERDIAVMRDKTNAYEKIAREFSEPEGLIKTLFHDDASTFGTLYTQTNSDFEDLMGILHNSRLASQYLSFAQLNGIEIRESSQVIDAAYDRATQTILVRPELDRANKTLLVARELRRMWQHRNGAGLHPLSLHPDYAVLVNRAQTADLLVSMIRIAWELQLSGHKDAWSRIENSTLCDLGRAFAREAMADFRSISNGLAARATFETWFLSERCRRCDRNLIQQMLADYQGYVFSDQPESSKLIALDLIRAMGKMPFGQNYIETVAGQIVTDPVFTDVRDRSNANFLWFIKFERSFVSEEKRLTHESGMAQKTADILAFPKTKRTSAEKLSSSSEGEIIALRRPAGE